MSFLSTPSYSFFSIVSFSPLSVPLYTSQFSPDSSSSVAHVVLRSCPFSRPVACAVPFSHLLSHRRTLLPSHALVRFHHATQYYTISIHHPALFLHPCFHVFRRPRFPFHPSFSPPHSPLSPVLSPSPPVLFARSHPHHRSLAFPGWHHPILSYRLSLFAYPRPIFSSYHLFVLSFHCSTLSLFHSRLLHPHIRMAPPHSIPAYALALLRPLSLSCLRLATLGPHDWDCSLVTSCSSPV